MGIVNVFLLAITYLRSCYVSDEREKVSQRGRCHPRLNLSLRIAQDARFNIPQDAID